MSSKNQNVNQDLILSYLNVIPAMILIVDEDVKIVDFNELVTDSFRFTKEAVFMQRGGDVLKCINSQLSPGGCGHAPACHNCVIRNSVTDSIKQHNTNRKYSRFTIKDGAKTIHCDFLVTTSPIQYQEETRVLLILEDINELTTLRKLIPICAHCKSVRNDQDYWESVEGYLSTQIEVDFSHGICPACMKIHYPEYVAEADDGDWN